MYKSVARRILLGIILIGLGVAVMGQVAGAWDLSGYSKDWWVLFIIVPGIWGIISSGFQYWNVGLVIIGCWLYADANHLIGNSKYSYMWLLGIMLIVLGIRFIFGSSHGVYKKVPVGVFDNSKFNESAEDYPNYNCVFSNLNIINKSQNLKGGKASTVFGKMVLDLRNVNITSNIVFEVSSVFGNLDVLTPANIAVRLKITPVFGDYHCFTVNNKADKSEPCIEIRGSAVFGQINTY